MNIIDFLLIENTGIEKDNLAPNLYFSYDDITFIGLDIKGISILKKYKKYDIINYKEKNLGEGYTEIKVIAKALEKYFIRILIDDRNLISDILIYSILDDETEKKYQRIFFSEHELELDEYLNGTNLLVAHKSDHIKIIRNPNVLLPCLGFEDWDFSNKHQNNIDEVLVNKSIFDSNLTFIKNGGERIILTINVSEYEYKGELFYLIGEGLV